MPFAALVLTGAVCAGFGLAPALVRRRAPGRAELLCAAVPFCLLWAGLFLVYSKTGLFAGFDTFRLLTALGGAVWLSGTVCAFRLYGGLRGAARLAAVLLAALFAAAGAECLLCNAPYYATHSYQPVELLPYLSADSTATVLEDGAFRVDRDHTVLRLSGLDQPIYNLQLDGLTFHYTGKRSADVQNPLFTITLSGTDDATGRENASWQWAVAYQAPRSWTRTLDFSGSCHTLTLNFAPFDGEYIWYEFDYTVAGLRANVPRSFDFSAVRLAALWLLVVAAWALRPQSGLWRTAFLKGRKSHRLAALLCGGVLAALAVAAPFADARASGVATATYNANDWDGVSRASITQHLNADQNTTTAQYGALAHSLLNGRLDLMIDPPESLLSLENPYDTPTRLSEAGDSLWDVAFYNGRYYVYFGIVPCLLFQLPFEALTGVQDLPNCFGMVVMALLFLLAVFFGVKAALRRWFPAASTAAYLLCCTGIAAGSGLYYLLLRAAVYEYAILCGMSFAFLALWQWLLAANLADAPAVPKARLRLHLTLGSLCMALVAGCRPQMVLFAFLAVPLFFGRYIRKKRLFTRDGMWDAVCFLLPVVLVAAGLMWYNAARFGSPFDFGANYNLTSNDMTKRGFNAGRIGPALFAFLAAPPHVSAVFPYVQNVPVATNYVGATVSEEMYGGLLWTAPALWALALLPFAGGRLRRTGCRGFVWYCVLAAPVMVVVDAEMAGVLYRYQADYAAPLLFAAMLCWLAAEAALARRASVPAAPGAPTLLRRDAARQQTALRLAFSLAVAAGAALSFFTFFAAEPWLYSQNPALYQNVSRLIQFWL